MAPHEYCRTIKALARRLPPSDAGGRERKAAAPSRCHLLGDRYRLRCTAARHVPRTVGFSVFLVHCAGRNVAGVTGTVSHTLGVKDKSYRAVEHEDARIKLMRVRLAMPMWFDLAFANVVTLLSEAGFKFGPIHCLLLPVTPNARRFAQSSIRQP